MALCFRLMAILRLEVVSRHFCSSSMTASSSDVEENPSNIMGALWVRMFPDMMIMKVTMNEDEIAPLFCLVFVFVW